MLGNAWEVEIKGDLSTRWGFPLRIYKSEWHSSKRLIVGFEFSNSGDFNGCLLGVVRSNEDINIKGGADSIESTYRDKLSKLNKKIKRKTNKWWLHYETFQRGDFIEYIKHEEDAETKLVNKLKEIVDIFETDSGLLSEINASIK